jgi:hypothetical protein
MGKQLKIGILQSKESVNIDLNKNKNFKLEFHKVKKV